MSVRSEFVVIGSGINGLVAAAELALAGRQVTLIERNPTIGGFIASGERTVSGFIHDTFSSWHPLFVSGGAHEVLGDHLRAAGLHYCNSENKVTAAVGSDGKATVAYRDPATTVAEFGVAADRDAYQQMLADLGSRAEVIFGALGSELSPSSVAKLAFATVKGQRVAGTETLLREALSSGRSYLSTRFGGWETDRLWSPWLLHAGLGPDSASGGVMLPVMAATMHQFGLPVVRGGAANFVAAFAQIFAENGVRVVVDSPVTQILTRDGTAIGVRTADEEYLAEGAVIAGVTPQALYTELLPDSAVRPQTRELARGYRYGKGAMQIHLALDRPMRWSDDRLDEVALIHLTDGSASMGIAAAQAQAGLLPGAPTIVVGQQYVLDPSRAPEGKATLWVQLQEVPYAPVGDSRDEFAADGSWTPTLAQQYADRVIDRIEAHAPGLRASILGRDIITPADLEAHNPNAVNGDPYAGTVELDQNLRWRPATSAGRHRTEINNLFHIGASTHPGPGLGGGSGHLTAQEILTAGSRRSLKRFFS